MNSTSKALAQTVLRQRIFGDELEAKLSAACDSTLNSNWMDVPPPWQEIQHRQAVLHEEISDLFVEQKAVQSRLVAELPLLPSEFVGPLTHLDQQVSFHDAGVCMWLQRMFPDRRRVDVREGQWIDGKQSFYATVHFSEALDPATAASRELSLSWRFPSSRFKRMYFTDAKYRPFVEYKHWADQSSVIRQESQSLTSELLRALLERIPELAFVAGYATSLILTVKGMGSLTMSTIPYFANPQEKVDSNGQFILGERKSDAVVG